MISLALAAKMIQILFVLRTALPQSVGPVSCAHIWCVIDTRGVPVSGRHADTAQTGTARSGTVLTWADTVRHGPAWRGLAWQIVVRGLADRSEVSGQ